MQGGRDGFTRIYREHNNSKSSAKNVFFGSVKLSV